MLVLIGMLRAWHVHDPPSACILVWEYTHLLTLPLTQVIKVKWLNSFCVLFFGKLYNYFLFMEYLFKLLDP